VIAVAVVALSQAPELRWYASGLFGSDAWLVWLFAIRAPCRSLVLRFHGPSNYLIVLLEVLRSCCSLRCGGRVRRHHIFERLKRAHHHGSDRSGTGPGDVGRVDRAPAAAGAAH